MQSSESFILQEIINPGRQLFTNQLLHQIYNKTLDKRKKGKNSHQNPPLNNPNISYSVFNLVKPLQLKLSSSQILASQLLKTNVINQKRTTNQREEELIKLYEDYQQSQRINKKFTKMLIKPIKAKTQETIKNTSLISFQQTFTNTLKQLINQMTTQILDEIQEKLHPKPQLTTTKNMFELGEHKMLYFISDAQNLCKKGRVQNQLNEFSVNFLINTIQNFKNQLKSNGVMHESNIENNTDLFKRFSSNFQALLPYYLQLSYHQNFSPLPWKNGPFQKQIQKSQFHLITGKVLYKYQHNLILLKDNKIKFKVFEYATKKYGKLRDFIEERISEKRINDKSKRQKEKIQENDNNLQKIRQIEKPQPKNSRYFPLDKKDFDEVIMNSDNSKQKDFVSKNLIRGFQKKSVLQIKLCNNQAKNHQDFHELSLDQFKFSKNSYFGQHEYQNLKQDKCQKAKIPKNLNLINQSQMMNPTEINRNDNYLSVQNIKFHRQLPFQKSKTSNCQNNPSKSLKSVSDSNSSDCWNQIRRFQQGKTTKKKKSFMVNKGQRSSQNNLMVMIKCENKRLLSKKSKGISFYPMKVGNLILQQNHNAYLQYNCQKQQPKNLSMKFLLDRKKHGINRLELVIPSLHQQNQLKLKDQQRAKQIIKVIIQLGGQILKIKQQSSYDQQQHKGCAKINSQLQIYKFYYQQLTYFQIIDSLNIEKQWLQNEIETKNANGWKY